MHEAYRYDDRGDTVDTLPFCSDACHRDHEGDAYEGWNGCVDEGRDVNYCTQCGVEIGSLVVNLIAPLFTESGKPVPMPTGQVTR